MRDTARSTTGSSRRRFLTTAAALGAAGALTAADRSVATPMSAPTGAQRRGVRYRGVCYTVGPGETPATAFSAARMRADLRAIRHDLHANSIKVTGDGVHRLTATAQEAAERGLYVRAEPTLGDRPQPEILDHLAEVGRHAEQLRRQGAKIELSVGCEFYLFVPGIIPGDNAVERIENLISGNVDLQQMQRRLDRFTARAAAVGRSVFHGPLSYAAAQDDQVDWELFDIVGIDYYSHHPRRQDYVRELRRYQRIGKPLAIAEFGTCAYKGAPDSAGMGWNVIDYTKQPPELTKPLVRSERTQAQYVTELFDVFDAMNLHAAMAFEFVTPEAPHWPGDPRHDLDMATYALVKTIRDTPGDPASDWHWEPKLAYHALAQRYARSSRVNTDR
ncbi:twin-arginine translocation signal domain-containing protein [Streptomyces sp. NBC_01304]|uniref:twin-arginine translocation signal domain-containing protein n=1 Tax=Streptomyces sp. NBC_01304 TaxID=2903818 RepID=UPI002E0FB4D1|nr:twin-arginine translocation signal domain-containing protein [Streptomyces sp. NBC_01304]